MKKISTLIIFAILAVAVLKLQAQKELPPAGGTPKDFTLPAKDTKLLDNGMKATFVQYGAIPKVNVSLIVKTGNVHEKADQIWLSDLTGNLMREGTKTMDFATISRQVAEMGGEISISVSSDQTTVSGSVLSEFAGDLIKIMGDMIMNPLFPESEVERLKNDLKRNLAVQKSRSGAIASEEFFKSIYPDHPYGRYYPTEEMLDTYTIDMAKNFYQENFGAKRSVLYVVGKFDEEPVARAFEETFTSWDSGPDVFYPAAVASRTSEVSIIDRKGAPQTTLYIGLPTLSPQDPEYVALQVTNSLLGGSFASRITSNIREDKGYTYSPRSVVQTHKDAAVWYEQADVATEHTGASLMEIAREISRLKKENPSSEELDGIKEYEAGLFVLRNSMPTGIIGLLNFIDLQGLDDSYLTNYVKNIFAVTPEQVSQITGDYIRYPDMKVVMVGDKEAIEKQNMEIEASRNLE